MKIAYNSAYVQTETLNFTFAQQAIVVYFCFFQLSRNHYAERKILMYMSIIFLPIMSECTLIASKQLIQPFTYTDRLLLLPYEHTCNLHYATSARTLAKIAQTAQNKCTASNDLLSPWHRR